MASGRLIDYVGSGPAANRPVAPDLAAGAAGFWYATDTGTLSVWDGAVWDTVGGGLSLAAVETVADTVRDMLAADVGKYLVATASTAKTWTVQPDATIAMPVNAEIAVENEGAADLTLVAGSGVTITAPKGGTLILETGDVAVLKRKAVDVWKLAGGSKAAGGGELWTPSAITTALWLDASNIATITLDGSSNIQTWADVKASGITAGNDTATARPAHGTESLNGLPFAVFDGSDDVLNFSTNPIGGGSIENALIAFVLNVKTHTVSTLFDLSGAGISSSGRYSANVPWIDGIIYYDVGNETSGSGRITATSPLAPNANGVVLFYSSTSQSTQIIRVNGITIASKSSAISTPIVGPGRLGGIPGTTRFDSVSIGEMVVLNAQTDQATIDKIEGYLAHKWGLAAGLPFDHPYKTSPPTL